MKHTGRVALVALVALVAPIVAGSGAAPAGATDPGTNGLVAFVTTRAGFPEIYTADPASGVEHNLSNGASETSPAWNPFGTKLAFSRSADVWVMKANGSGRVDLTASDPLTDGEPAWSPDAKKIAFSSDRDTSGRTQIFAMNASGSHVVRLSNDAGVDTDPQWSPDGTHILFVSTASGNNDIWSMRANGAAATDLTNNTSSDDQPSWSPDGKHVVFRSGRSHPGSVGADLFVMDADGGNVVALLHESNGYSDGAYPAFSPDGTQIAFSANNGQGSQQLWVVSAGGGQNVRLTNDAGSPANVAADWQPIVPSASLAVRPHSGVPGTSVKVTGSGFAPGEKVKPTFTDSGATKTAEPVLTADTDGAISTTVAVPAGAAAGKAIIAGVGVRSGLTARKAFTVTSPT